MDTKKFYDTVKRMREAQKQYFRTRNKKILIRSINLETTIDNMIQEEENKIIAKQMEIEFK